MDKKKIKKGITQKTKKMSNTDPTNTEVSNTDPTNTEMDPDARE